MSLSAGPLLKLLVLCSVWLFEPGNRLDMVASSPNLEPILEPPTPIVHVLSFLSLLIFSVYLWLSEKFNIGVMFVKEWLDSGTPLDFPPMGVNSGDVRRLPSESILQLCVYMFAVVLNRGLWYL